MAEIFLTASVQVLIEKLLSSTMKTLVSKLVGNRKILEGWKSELESIQAVLADAEQRQCSSKAVKTWLEQLQDVALDMEDVLGDFEIQVQAREFSQANACGVTGLATNMAIWHGKIKPTNRDKIDEITERLKKIQSMRETLGLSAQSNMQHHTSPSETLRNQQESTFVPSKGKIIGRDDEKQKIINKLLNDDQAHQGDENYVVIPIVGKGGIGKTTLAQSVYNDEQLEGHFDLMAWVCVYDVFDVTRITTTICKEGGTVVDFDDLNEAQKQLKKVLTGQKFLIVLDDIWNEEYSDWYKLQTPFQYAAKGSRVIMTTRNQKIAKVMSTDPSHNNIVDLQGLSDDDCWCAFQQHANNDSDLAELRDDIIKKCKGLPLAAKALGGLLKKTDDKRRRRSILESDLWIDEENGVIPVLRLSYHYLPSHLKCIFAYCSVLCKDYTFTEMEIILLWMAQGFLPENQERRMEDFGHDYFNDLKSRSLFEQSSYSKDRFVMHDLIHDLALWAAGGICYVIGTKDIAQVDNWQRIRHVFFTEDGHTTLESQLPMASQLRTFYSDNYNGCNWAIENLNFTKDFCYLRTLRLSSSTTEVLPECIGGLEHLRFLRLRFWSIKELPISINKLWNLQTLWLEECYDLEKVPYIGDLKHLRFFSLRLASRIKELPKSISNLWNLQTLCLRHCSRLKKVPNIRSLERLHHLEIVGTPLEEMPMGFEKVKNLQSLDKLILGHGCGARIRELKDLNQLKGELEICGLENVPTVEDAKEAQLDKKCRLDKLYLDWGTGRDEVDDDTRREVVEQLKPHSSIKKCELYGYRGLAFPAWLGDPCFNNMVRISLIDCENCKCLPPLGQLPRLEKLWIQRMGGIIEIGPEFYGNRMCSNPFPTLKRLHFEDMKYWERWLPADNDRAFPCLENLIIEGCDSLEGDVPPQYLPSLKTLHIFGCKELSVSVPLQSLSSLEKLNVDRCNIQSITTTSEGALKEEHGMSPSPKGSTPSPCELPHLTSLSIRNCPSLISFPDGLFLPALETLYITDCENMESLPSELHKYNSLQTLKVFSTPKIQCIPEGGLPKNLKTLVIRQLSLKSIRCSILPYLTHLDIMKCPELESFEDGALPPQLRFLCIRNCPKLQFFVKQGFLPTNLKTLDIQQLNLKSISCSTLPSLTDLDIKDCPELESFEDDALPPQLHSLRIGECPKLQIQFFVKQGCLPTNLKRLEIFQMQLNQAIQAWGLHRLHSLKKFTLKEVDTEEHLSLPSSLSEINIEGNQNVKNLCVVDGTTPLTELYVKDCPKLESVVGNFTCLSRLSLKSCPKLQPLPEIGLLLNLESLRISRVDIDKPIREWGLHLLTSLNYLGLVDLGSCTDAVEHIPGQDDLQLPSSLGMLDIVGFQKLKSIRCSTLPELTSLKIKRCPQLESLAENALPPHLQLVQISECDLIKPRLVRDPHGRILMDGERWSPR